MLKFQHGVGSDQYQQHTTVIEFNDEGEVLDFAQKLKLEAENIKRGNKAPEVGKTVDVEFSGDEIHAEVIVELFPSFSEWKCPTCGGQKTRCRTCNGEGWDLSGMPNGAGRYIGKIQIGPHNFLYSLLETRYWTEVENEAE